MKQTVTMADVARATGLSKSTVSLALGGSPLLPEATRKRVAAAAEELGYRRDPLLSALSARRRRGGAPTHHGEIALLPLAPAGAPRFLYPRLLWDAAQVRAESLGYHVNEYELGPDAADLRRLARILRARGVVGVLWGTRIRPEWFEAFEWEHFSHVTLARSNARYPLHIVNSDLSSAVLQTWGRIEKAGYRRVAVLIRRQLDDSLGRRLSLMWRGICSGASERFCADPIRHHEGLLPGPDVEIWLREQAPDLLVVDGEAACRAVTAILPPRCHRVAVGLREVGEEFAGVYHPTGALAEVALLKLDGMIRMGERGLAANRQTTLVEGRWHAGRSAPGLI